MKVLTDGVDKYKINIISIVNSVTKDIDQVTGEYLYIDRKYIIAGLSKNFSSNMDDTFYLSLPYDLLSKLTEVKSLFSGLEDILLNAITSGTEYQIINAHHEEVPDFHSMKMEELDL